MGRRFQSGHSIIFPVPAALNATDAGPRTIMAVGKATSAYQCIVWTTPTGATPGWWLEIDTAGTLHLNYGTGNSSLRNVGTIGSGADEIWTARKDNGGSVNPFGRRFTGAGFTTDGGDVDAGATLVDGLAIDTTYGIQVGVWGKLAGSPFFSTDLTLYFLAFWNTLQAGATLAGLTKTKAGITGAAAPPDYWISFEGSTTTDSVGGTPTVTGTTVVGDPSGFFAATGAEPSGLAIPVALGSPTVAIPSAAPTGLAVPLGLGSPTVALNRTAAPTGLAIPVLLGSPTVTRQSAAPAGLAVALGLGSPTVALNRTAAPTGLAIPISLGSPVVSAGAFPAGLAIPVSLGAPTVTRQSAAPAGLAIPLGLGSPAGALGRMAAPAGLAISVNLGTPSAGDQQPYVTATLTPSAMTAATLTTSTSSTATLTTSAISPATLTPSST